jgi:hypothetical protein
MGHSFRGDAPIAACFDTGDAALPEGAPDRLWMPRNDFGECGDRYKITIT